MPDIGHGLQAWRDNLQDSDLPFWAGLRGPDRHAQTCGFAQLRDFAEAATSSAAADIIVNPLQEQHP